MLIRWGIIGCGNVTEVKSGPGFQKANGSQLVAVMRRNGELAKDYADRHGVPRWYDDAHALINDPDVDAVSIATPPGTHMEYALKVCAAGKPAYVEKPMARTAAECETMVKAFARAGLPLYVAYYRRGLKRFIRVKELVESGRIGDVTHVCVRYSGHGDQRMDEANLPWRLNAKESGGGLFFDLGSHTLDILDYILGPLCNVRGSAANARGRYDVEELVTMSFQTESGAVGTGVWNFTTSVRTDVIEVVGEGGSITLSTFGEGPIRLTTSEGVEEFDGSHPLHVQQPLIQSIVDELHGRGECPSTGESALRTARVMDTVVDEYYAGRHDAFWSRPHTWRRKGGFLA